MPDMTPEQERAQRALREALDELSAQEVLAVVEMAAASAYPRDRDKFVAACPLSPDNLVGSYFRYEDEEDEARKVEEGLVVAVLWAGPVDPFALYLVEFFGPDLVPDEATGALGSQQVIGLDRMLSQKWSFYDSETWLASHGAPEGKAPRTDKAALKKEPH